MCLHVSSIPFRSVVVVAVTLVGAVVRATPGDVVRNC